MRYKGYILYKIHQISPNLVYYLTNYGKPQATTQLNNCKVENLSSGAIHRKKKAASFEPSHYRKHFYDILKRCNSKYSNSIILIKYLP